MLPLYLQHAGDLMLTKESVATQLVASKSCNVVQALPLLQTVALNLNNSYVSN
jgi:hypothetical protein